MSHHYLLPEISQPGKIGCNLPALDVPPTELPPKELLRQELELPEVSEAELMRYFTALSKLNYGVDTGFYPLGSCTMNTIQNGTRILPDFPVLPQFTPSSQRSLFREPCSLCLSCKSI